ncbi:MAG: RDD family protein, partial [Candidatus Hodarchaeota archaeon]
VQTVPPNQSQQGPSYVLASWPARFVAWLLDGIFLGVVLVILVAIGFSVGLASDFRPGPMVAFLVPLFIFWVFIDFGYGPIMEYFYGATFGKMILGLKVVDVKTGEKPTSFLKVLVSNLGKELLLFWDVLLGLLVSDCAKMNQRIFQRAVDLVVIRNGVTSPGYV